MASLNPPSDPANGEALDKHIQDLSPILDLTREMLKAVLSNHFADLAKLMMERDELLKEVDFESGNFEASQLQEILTLNEGMRKPLEEKRDELARELKGIQSGRKGVAAYQSAGE